MCSLNKVLAALAAAVLAVSAVVPAAAAPPRQEEEREWLVMLYQNADDEVLEQDIFIDLNEAEWVGSSDAVTVHFIGSIVYVMTGQPQYSRPVSALVIDGQQRLTTVSLLIEALARALGNTEPVEDFSAAKLRDNYLSNPRETGDRYFKLLLSQTDKESLKAIIRRSEQPKEPSLRVTQNFALFTELLAEQKGDLAPSAGASPSWSWWTLPLPESRTIRSSSSRA